VYVIGETGILEELDLKGITHLGGPEDGSKEVTLKKGEYMEHDPEVGFVAFEVPRGV
jgi:phosphoglycolate phosphatase